MRSPSLSAATFSLLTAALVACGEEPPPTGPAGPDGALESASAVAGLRVVNSPADPGDGTCDVRQCTLREAIEDPGTTQVQFATGFTGPITLARAGLGGGTLIIDKSLTVIAPAAGVVIQRRTTDPQFRIFRVDSGVTAALSNLTIRGGTADQQAGGILNLGTLSLTNVKVRNSAPDGIVNRGTLTLTRSAVTGSARAGITTHDHATLTLTQSSVSRNGTTGIVNRGGTLTITGGAVSENAGAGISQDWATSTLDRVKVVDNVGGGIGSWNSNVTVTRSTIARNSGGGIGAGRGHLTISGSTVNDNTTPWNGGGISCYTVPRAGVEVRITNSTISGNSAAYGGGIFCEDDYYGAARVYLVNSTVAFNSATAAGGGIAQSAGDDAWIDLVNTLVAGNTAPVAPDIRANTNEYDQVSIVASLIGDGSGSGIPNGGDNQVGNVPPYTAPIDPKLGALANNGGPTRTHALLIGSPAIDGAEPTLCPATDQRGVARPQGEGCDIGSYERE